MRRVVVISASFGAGHDGAAAELTRRLETLGCTVERHDFVELLPRGAGAMLRNLYRRQLTMVPSSWGWLMTLESRGGVASRTSQLTAVADNAIRAAIGPEPALAISTYPLASQVLGRLRRRGRLAAPAVTYLTDMSVHRLWIAEGIDVHLALHDEPARRAKALGASDVRTVAPAVAPAFTSPGSGRDDLPDNAALIVAGAWGVGEIERTSREIAASGVAVPVVACGRNEALRRRLQRSRHAIALGWTDDMAALMRACRVVVQNAGGLSSLEALSLGVPVVSYRCLPGHGRSNVDALDKAGWAMWIRTPEELPLGLRVAMDSASRFNPAAERPETALTDLMAVAA
jgi:UDP-N-acetylglucosamine:LPS N-acetylglucosamine transferase